ncbi:MAG: hypothetical protein CO035_00085, partial [Candidatus Omnitrophica bacterium CG_4_9_14_0_2_um_filter_42_8]
SMEPVFKNGDKVKVEPIESINIKVGDIIVFNRNILVCHRAWGRFKKDDRLYFLERGDNSTHMGVVSEDDIIGKAVYIIGKGRIKKPSFCFNRGIIILLLLEVMMYPYIRISDFMKRRIFFEKSNLFSRVFGTIIWKIYYFYLNRATKKRIC